LTDEQGKARKGGREEGTQNAAIHFFFFYFEVGKIDLT